MSQKINRVRRQVADLKRRKAHIDRSMADRREAVERLHHVQQVLFAVLKTQGRIRVPKEAFDGLDGANITMREDGELWVLDFVPPGFEKPEGAA